MVEKADATERATPEDNVDEVFEVFQQAQKDPSPHHGGNLRAPDSELAVHYGKEFYGRRQESLRIWIIPRAALWEVSNPTQAHASLHPLIEQAPMSKETPQAFAVFGQKEAGKPLIWIQDLEDTTLLQAVEQAMQDGEGKYQRFWFCPRSAIIELTDPDLLQPPLDRSYRRLDGYNIREKLRAARQRVQAQGGKVS